MATVKGPWEVKIVAWIVLLIGAVKLLFIAAFIWSPKLRGNLDTLGVHELDQALLALPLYVHYLVSGVGTAVLLATGFGLLHARQWARITLALWSGWILLFSYLTTGSLYYVAPKFVVFLVIMAILFSPRARAYFRAGPD